MTDTREPEIVDGEVVEEIEEPERRALALDAITQAEIDIAIATAKRWPRSLARFKDRVTSMATVDEETAAECFYSLRRQGKTIQGPSVRLAEMAIAAYQNIRAGARILGETEDGKFVRALGVCHDLENNVYVAIEATRRITTRAGKKYGDDMIGVTSNAAASIALRNAAFRVIPKAMIKGAYARAKQVATGDAKTITERREQVVERLSGLNPLITEERILAAVGRPSIEEVTLDDLTHLIGLGTAIKEGDTTIDEAFPEAAKSSSVGAEEIVGGEKKAGEKGAKETEPKPPEATVGGEEEPEKEEPYTELSPSAWSRLERQAEEAGIQRQEWAAILARHTPDPHTVPPASAETDLMRVIEERGRKR